MNEPLKILESVNQFYSQSFSQLIALVAIILTFAGVVLPLVISVLQSRQFKIEQKQLEESISIHLSNIKEELKAEIQKLIEQEKNKLNDMLQSYEEKINNINSLAIARTLHLQGNNALEKGHPESACSDFLRAAKRYAECSEESNMQRVLRSLIEKCLPRLDKISFEEISDRESLLVQAIAAIKKINSNDRYTDLISDLNRAIQATKARSPSK